MSGSGEGVCGSVSCCREGPARVEPDIAADTAASRRQFWVFRREPHAITDSVPLEVQAF